MKLLLIAQTSDGYTLTEKELDLEVSFNKHSKDIGYRLPDSFSMTEFLEEARIEESNRELSLQTHE